MILIIDNYDSFTYNLYQIFLKLNFETKVVRSDKISIEEIESMHPTHIIISPGPGTPHEAGISIELVQKLKGKYPILGVCLGHQAILAAHNVPIVNADKIVHGKVEKLTHNGKGIFRNISPNTPITRYHSLVGKEKDIPKCFEISAKSEDNEVMAVSHKDYCLIGVQFHPESIGTKEGEKMIKNFLNYKKDSIPIKTYLNELILQKDLSIDQAYDLMDEITEGNLEESQIASILTSLQIKGVTPEELAGFAKILREKASYFPKPKSDEIRLDTCGTGGSKEAKTFNVSTVVAFLTCAGGIKVVKHGNKGVTSGVGSADLFESLGVNIDMDSNKSFEIFEKLGITFLYARKFHSAMKFVAGVRQSLGFRTIFNLIGPLSNPAYATHQIIGVFDKEYTVKMAQALNYLGVKRAMVVHGFDGLDEISLSSPTHITELKNGWIKTYIFNPEEIGLKLVKHNKLIGGDLKKNKNICKNILKGKKSMKADLAYLNAGAAFYICGKAENIKEGYLLAKKIASSGEAIKIIENLANISK